MSVETSYFIVDWAKLQSMAPDTDLVAHFILGPNGDGGVSDDEDSDDEEGDGSDLDDSNDDADEEEFDEDEAVPEWQAEGARALPFGDYDYYFQSWGFSTEVSDWLRPQREQLDARVSQPFASLFSDIGVLFDDDYGPNALKSGVEFSDSSLIATISPKDVAKLRATARAIDRSAVEREFGRALAARPCPGLPNGKVVVAWLDALDAALSGIRDGEGILILAPA
jgi:hypothetical protein